MANAAENVALTQESMRSAWKAGLVAQAERAEVATREARERFRVGPQRPAAVVRADLDDLLLQEAGASVLALVEVRDHPRTRPTDRIKAAVELLNRALGPVGVPAVTVNVDSSLMALARRLDSSGMEVVRARARGELGPPSVEGAIVDGDGVS